MINPGAFPADTFRQPGPRVCPSSKTLRDRPMIARLFRLTAWLASGVALAGFALLCARGLTSPAPFDATERGLFELAQRLEAHAPLYVGPAPAGAPALLPGFPLVASVLVDTLGPNLMWLRLISLLSIIALALLVMAVVHEETENRTLAVATRAR
jgi:hypothetical protein